MQGLSEPVPLECAPHRPSDTAAMPELVWEWSHPVSRHPSRLAREILDKSLLEIGARASISQELLCQGTGSHDKFFSHPLQSEDDLNSLFRVPLFHEELPA